MGFDVGQPKVVISDGPPPVVQCRDLKEVQACDQLLSILRRGQDPVLFVTRLESGEYEVHARGANFPTIKRAIEVMDQAKAKLIDTLFRKRIPALEVVR